MRRSTLDLLKRHLRRTCLPQRRPSALVHSVDRHLKELTATDLQKLRTGLYYSPRKFEFGEAPADEHELVKAFLKTDRFVLTSPNAYNQLDLGQRSSTTTGCLQSETAWDISLGNRMVTFERRMNVPRQLSPEFLLVDLVNELGDLAEDRDAVLSRVREKAKEMDRKSFHARFSLRQILHTEKVSGDVATCLTLFCMSEAISRHLSRPLPTPRRSMIQLSWKKTTGSCTPSLGSSSLA